MEHGKLAKDPRVDTFQGSEFDVPYKSYANECCQQAPPQIAAGHRHPRHPRHAGHPRHARHVWEARKGAVPCSPLE